MAQISGLTPPGNTTNTTAIGVAPSRLTNGTDLHALQQFLYTPVAELEGVLPALLIISGDARKVTNYLTKKAFEAKQSGVSA